MSTSPSGSDPLPDDLDDLDGPDDPDPSGEAASDPESARQEAEDALAEIEALADLDEDPDTGTGAEDAETDPSAGQTASASDLGDPAGPPSPPEAEPEAPDANCANCGAPLHGEYCSQCGQKAADRIVPLWYMINDALEAIFQLDLRIFRTLPKFFFLPGRLTKEYINGRRKRYTSPFRLYLVSTFLLFAVIALTTTGNFGFVLDPQGMARLNPPNTALSASRSPDTTASKNNASVFGDSEQRKKRADALRSDSTFINLEVYDNPEANKRLERVLRMKVAQAIENPWEAVNRMIDQGPYLMFLLLPIFAFLLKILYIRRGRLYMEHLFFSLNVHALAFSAFTIGLLLEQTGIGWLNAVAPWIEASPFLYLILGMSHVYEQGLIKSSIKAFILLLLYSIVLAVGFVLLLFVAILFM